MCGLTQLLAPTAWEDGGAFRGEVRVVPARWSSMSAGTVAWTQGCLSGMDLALTTVCVLIHPLASWLVAPLTGGWSE